MRSSRPARARRRSRLRSARRSPALVAGPGGSAAARDRGADASGGSSSSARRTSTSITSACSTQGTLEKVAPESPVDGRPGARAQARRGRPARRARRRRQGRRASTSYVARRCEARRQEGQGADHALSEGDGVGRAALTGRCQRRAADRRRPRPRSRRVRASRRARGRAAGAEPVDADEAPEEPRAGWRRTRSEPRSPMPRSAEAPPAEEAHPPRHARRPQPQEEDGRRGRCCQRRPTPTAPPRRPSRSRSTSPARTGAAARPGRPPRPGHPRARPRASETPTARRRRRRRAPRRQNRASAGGGTRGGRNRQEEKAGRCRSAATARRAGGREQALEALRRPSAAPARGPNGDERVGLHADVGVGDRRRVAASSLHFTRFAGIIARDTCAMDYAIIRVGGKQYRVREGETLVVDRVRTDEGETFSPDVLLGDGGVRHREGRRARARAEDPDRQVPRRTGLQAPHRVPRRD